MPSAMLDRRPLRPLVQLVLAKIKIGLKRKRELFGDDADEAMNFFNGPANWMFQDKYARNKKGGFLANLRDDDDTVESIMPPAFQMCVNKVAEMRDLYGPTLYHHNPVINVEPHDPPVPPPQVLGIDPNPPPPSPPPPGWPPGMPPPPSPQQMLWQQQLQQFQQIMQQQANMAVLNDFRANLMEYYLNYIQTENDKKDHSRKQIDETLIKGMGIVWHTVQARPGFKSRLVASEFGTIDDLVIDPDAESWNEVWWTARKRIQPHWEVEDRFGLPRDTLKGKGSWASFDQQSGEAVNDPKLGSSDTRSGKDRSNDLVVYWEWYSKMGMGDRLSEKNGKDKSTYALPDDYDGAFDELGQNCYLCVCNGVPYPLNLPPHLWTGDPRDDDLDGSKRSAPDTTQDSANDKFELPKEPQTDPLTGQPVMDATGEVVTQVSQEAFNACQWPYPLWIDGGWPFTPLAFKWVPNQVWPMSPIKPAIGYLRFINWSMSFLAVHIRKSCCITVGVLKAAGEDIKKALLSGIDYNVVELSEMTGKKIDELVSFLKHPEFNADIWKVISEIMERFAEATGLNELMYGQTPQAMRSAQEAGIKQHNSLLRPDDMANLVEDCLSKVASREAMLARMFLEPDDVAPVLGPLGAMAWGKLIQSADYETVAREFNYRIEAGSARKPNKDTAIQNANAAAQGWGQILTQYTFHTGDVGPINAMLQMWGKANDCPMPQLKPIPLPPPPGQPGQPAPPGAPAPVGVAGPRRPGVVNRPAKPTNGHVPGGVAV